MIQLKLADYFETQELAKKVKANTTLRTLAYKLLDKDKEQGFCIFSLIDKVCVIEAVSLQKEQLELSDGLLKACFAYCFAQEAIYFSFANKQEEDTYLPILLKNKEVEKPFKIEPIISHCHS